MKVIGVIVLLFGLAALTACNKGGNSGGAVVTKAGDAVAAADEHAGHDHAEGEHHAGETAEEHASHAEGEEHKEGEKHKEVKLPATVELASGETVPVVGVVKLDQEPTAYKGQVAVIGTVETVVADKHAFTLCDAGAEVGCKDGCCPASKFPVKVPVEEFDGKLPEVNQQVTVIGVLTPGETGYSFAVQEVRVGDETTIKPKAADKQA